jgi:2-oxoisovalerate dehydrogenase E1 component alpha subunit
MSNPRFFVENRDRGAAAPVSAGSPGGSASLWHVPEAPHRPGDEPNFAGFAQQPADLPRPEPLADYDALRPHAAGLVRVMDDDAQARGPWNPTLEAVTLRRALEMMIRVRAFDARMMAMQRQGRLSFYLESRGEEGVAVGGGLALCDEDLLFPSYRQQALFLLRGMSLLDMMCQCIGNGADHGKGRQMPIHYSWRQGRIVSISSPVGTQFPQAVGAAMAAAIRGDRGIVATWIGEGTAAQGDFHYGLNFASVYRPPVIMHVVNNQWAISTHCNLASGGPSFAARADAYGLPGIRVDGNDLLAVYSVTAWAAERARRGGGPTLVELVTYRAGAHSSSDDPSHYRPKDEASCWPGGDPITRLAQHLIRTGEWTPAQQQRLEEHHRQEIAETFAEAERFGSLATGPFAAPQTLFDDVYAYIPWHLEQQRRDLCRSLRDESCRTIHR